LRTTFLPDIIYLGVASLSTKEIFLGILTSIVGNLLTIIFLTLLTLTVTILARFFRRAKRKTPYYNMVLSDPKIHSYCIANFSVSTRYHRKSPFKNALPTWDINFLATFYDKLTESHSFNGSCLRLDKISFEGEQILLDFSTVQFFDLLSTNITFSPGNIRCINLWRCLTLLPDFMKYYSLIAEHKRKILPGKIPTTIAEVLSNNRLANVLAVSTNVIDAQGRALIIKRTSKITISGSIYTVASTGTVVEHDLVGDKSNVITRAAARETKEETGIDAQPENMKILDIILTRQKYQPTAVTEYTIDDISKIIENISSAKDFKQETQEAFVLDLNNKDTFFAVMTRLDFSPASAYSLELSFTQHHRLSNKEYRLLMKKHSRKPGNYRLCADWKKRSKVITIS